MAEHGHLTFTVPSTLLFEVSQPSQMICSKAEVTGFATVALPRSSLGREKPAIVKCTGFLCVCVTCLFVYLK